MGKKAIFSIMIIVLLALFSYSSLAVAPTVTSDLPTFYNKGKIDVNGHTEPNTTLILFVNGIRTRQVPGGRTGPSGDFAFRDIIIDTAILNQEFKFYLNKDDEENNQVFGVALDLISPELSWDKKIPDILLNNTFNYSFDVKDTNIKDAKIEITGPGSYTFSKSYTSLTNNQKITEQVNLNDDGKYNWKIMLTDLAGNSKVYQNETLKDAQPPQISNIIPEGSQQIYYDRAKKISIKGLTKPGAAVFIIYNISTTNEKTSQTTAKEDGTFEFKDLDLTAVARGLLEPREVNPNDAASTALNPSQLIQIKLWAKDTHGKIGDTKSINYRITTCGSGLYAWSISSLPDYQFPQFFSTERLAEGTQNADFILQFDYVGDTENMPTISGITLNPACLDNELRDKRYQSGCDMMKGVTPLKRPLGQTKTKWYISYRPLKKLTGMETWLDNDWGSWIKAVSNEVTFPLKIQVKYSEMEINEATGTSQRSIIKTQTICYDGITYPIDSARIDPRRNFLMNYLLNDGLKGLKKLSEYMTKATDNLQTGAQYTATACMGSYIAYRGVSFYEKFACNKYITLPSKDCEGKDIKTVNDADLQKCFSRCAGAWKAEESLYRIYRLTCDRIFGRSTPARWTADPAVNNEALSKMSEPKADNVCKAEQAADSAKGKDISKVKCPDSADENECYTFRMGKIGKGTNLGDIYGTYKGIYNQNVINYYTLDYLKGNYNPVDKLIALPVPNNENKVFIRIPANCDIYCSSSVKKYDDGKCISKSQQCNSQTIRSLLIANQIIKEDDKTNFKVDGEFLTQDCPNDKEFLSKGYESTSQCCCYKTTGTTVPDKNKIVLYEPGNEPAGPNKWSLRTDKNKIVTTGGGNTYNPNRYYKERDFMSCWGMNSWMDSLNRGIHPKSNSQNIPIINPTGDLITAIQCANIAQVYKRSEAYTNVVNGIVACLEEVKVSGTGGSAICKEAFTQHLCGMFSWLVTSAKDGCIFGQRVFDPIQLQATVSSSSTEKIISAGAGAIRETITSMGDDLKSDYNNVNFNSLLGFTSGNIARRVCMAAFGYNFGLTPMALIDSTYSSTYATSVTPIHNKREWVGFNPTNGNVQYEYRFGLYIIPGCTISSVTVALSCVSSAELGKSGVDCANHECDCVTSRLSTEITQTATSAGRLTQGQPKEVPYNGVIDANRRFDHLKIILQTDKNQDKSCLPEDFRESDHKAVIYAPITDRTLSTGLECSVDATSGYFGCAGGDFGEEGIAYMIGSPIEPIEGQNYYEGQDINFYPTIYKNGPDMCLYVAVKNQLDVIVKDKNGAEAKSYTEILSNGTVTIPPIRLLTGISRTGIDGVHVQPSVASYATQPTQQTAATCPSTSLSLSISDNTKSSTVNTYTMIVKRKQDSGDGKNWQVSVTGQGTIKVSDQITNSETFVPINFLSPVTITNDQTSFVISGAIIHECVESAKFLVTISPATADDQAWPWKVYWEIKQKPRGTDGSFEDCDYTDNTNKVTADRTDIAYYNGIPQEGKIHININKFVPCKTDADCTTGIICCPEINQCRKSAECIIACGDTKSYYCRAQCKTGEEPVPEFSSGGTKANKCAYTNFATCCKTVAPAISSSGTIQEKFNVVNTNNPGVIKSAEDLVYITRLVYFEAGGQNFDAIQAAIDVIYNRWVYNKKYSTARFATNLDSGVMGVISYPNAFASYTEKTQYFNFLVNSPQYGILDSQNVLRLETAISSDNLNKDLNKIKEILNMVVTTLSQKESEHYSSDKSNHALYFRNIQTSSTFPGSDPNCRYVTVRTYSPHEFYTNSCDRSLSLT